VDGEFELGCRIQRGSSAAKHVLRMRNARGYISFLLSESSSGKCSKLHTVVANNRDHTSFSFYFCMFAPHILYMGVVLRAHPVHGESHVQHNANREVATLAARLGQTC